ncbi:hypothetical protein [Micromonospora inaquosa]|uniref:Uncharacterized protein n=1 Tax=Micromonospora inaquosa TaxID=2203716 RepID=A0A3N9WD01_9ACTN|nr:hypothetical protein [Micromonospora inaquosa]RQW98747.1 hypothetical protein DLJ59_26545 [Micromonospora inaquosa]
MKIDVDTLRIDGVPNLAERPMGGQSTHDGAGDQALDRETCKSDSSDQDVPADLVALLPAARAARTELTREGHAVSRDALARRLRRNGYSIRNSGVSELLTVLRRDDRGASCAEPTTSVQHGNIEH